MASNSTPGNTSAHHKRRHSNDAREQALKKRRICIEHLTNDPGHTCPSRDGSLGLLANINPTREVLSLPNLMQVRLYFATSQELLDPASEDPAQRPPELDVSDFMKNNPRGEQAEAIFRRSQVQLALLHARITEHYPEFDGEGGHDLYACRGFTSVRDGGPGHGRTSLAVRPTYNLIDNTRTLQDLVWDAYYRGHVVSDRNGYLNGINGYLPFVVVPHGRPPPQWLPDMGLEGAAPQPSVQDVLTSSHHMTLPIRSPTPASSVGIPDQLGLPAPVPALSLPAPGLGTSVIPSAFGEPTKATVRPPALVVPEPTAAPSTAPNPTPAGPEKTVPPSIAGGQTVQPPPAGASAGLQRPAGPATGRRAAKPEPTMQHLVMLEQVSRHADWFRDAAAAFRVTLPDGGRCGPNAASIRALNNEIRLPSFRPGVALTAAQFCTIYHAYARATCGELPNLTLVALGTGLGKTRVACTLAVMFHNLAITRRHAELEWATPNGATLHCAPDKPVAGGCHWIERWGEKLAVRACACELGINEIPYGPFVAVLANEALADQMQTEFAATVDPAWTFSVPGVDYIAGPVTTITPEQLTEGGDAMLRRLRGGRTLALEKQDKAIPHDIARFFLTERGARWLLARKSLELAPLLVLTTQRTAHYLKDPLPTAYMFCTTFAKLADLVSTTSLVTEARVKLQLGQTTVRKLSLPGIYPGVILVDECHIQPGDNQVSRYQEFWIKGNNQGRTHLVPMSGTALDNLPFVARFSELAVCGAPSKHYPMLSKLKTRYVAHANSLRTQLSSCIDNDTLYDSLMKQLRDVQKLMASALSDMCIALDTTDLFLGLPIYSMPPKMPVITWTAVPLPDEYKVPGAKVLLNQKRVAENTILPRRLQDWDDSMEEDKGPRPTSNSLMNEIYGGAGDPNLPTMSRGELIAVGTTPALLDMTAHCRLAQSTFGGADVAARLAAVGEVPWRRDDLQDPEQRARLLAHLDRFDQCPKWEDVVGRAKRFIEAGQNGAATRMVIVTTRPVSEVIMEALFDRHQRRWEASGLRAEVRKIFPGTSTTERTQTLRMFRERTAGPMIILGSSSSIGTGVDGLQVADEAVLVEMTLNKDYFRQFTGRFCRPRQNPAGTNLAVLYVPDWIPEFGMKRWATVGDGRQGENSSISEIIDKCDRLLEDRTTN